MNQNIFILGLAAGVISVTTSRTHIFKPLRRFIAGKSQWLGELVRCPYCTSHWVCFVATLIYRPRLLDLWFPLDLVVSAFFMIFVATIGVGCLRWALEGMVPVDDLLEDETVSSSDIPDPD
jgi:hypothetical protein